jgi:clan AA aspartic protease (TIGR02281 family)
LISPKDATLKKLNVLLVFFISFYPLISQAETLTLPLVKTSDGHYQIPATINGISATFVLDTGATGTVIDSNKLSLFGINIKADKFEGVQLGSNESGKVEVWPIRIDTFYIGSKKVNINDIYANNMKDQFDDTVAGIIGHDAIAAIGALIDIKSALLIIPDNINIPLVMLGDKPISEYQHLTIQTSDMGFSFVDAILGSYPVRLIVDSGASETVLDLSMLKRLGFKVNAHPTAKTILPNGVEEAMSVLQDTRLRLGESILSDDFFASDFSALMQAINQEQQRPFVGILGNKQLLELHAVIDLAHALIYIKP